MKKVFVVLLTCIFLMSCVFVATAETVVSYTYDEEPTEIEDNDIPKSDPIEVDTEEIIPDEIISEEVIPLSAPEVLPQTGGIPVEAFYGLGVVCILAAVVVSKRKSPKTVAR